MVGVLRRQRKSPPKADKFYSGAFILPNPNLFSKQILISRTERVVIWNEISRSDNVVMRTKKAERSACCISRPLGREQTSSAPLSPRKLGEPQKTKFAFSFFKKNWGGEKKG